MANVKEGSRGTWKVRKGYEHYVVGVFVGGVHKQVAVARGVAMFALKGPIEDGLEVHHNDQNKANDWPSNLAICTRQQHRILDALSLLRNNGFDIPTWPNGEYHPMLAGVIWIGDLLEDCNGVIEEAVAWFKTWAYDTYEWKSEPPLEYAIERRM